MADPNTVHFIRHAQFEADGSLTPLTKQPARQTSERLCNTTRIYARDLRSAKKTALIIAKHINVPITCLETVDEYQQQVG